LTGAVPIFGLNQVTDPARSTLVEVRAQLERGMLVEMDAKALVRES
jgi:hypothetical protein